MKTISIAAILMTAAVPAIAQSSHAVQIVPEPSGIVALATGITGFIGYCSHKRSRKLT